MQRLLLRYIQALITQMAQTVDLHRILTLHGSRFGTNQQS